MWSVGVSIMRTLGAVYFYEEQPAHSYAWEERSFLDKSQRFGLIEVVIRRDSVQQAVFGFRCDSVQSALFNTAKPDLAIPSGVH